MTVHSDDIKMTHPGDCMDEWDGILSSNADSFHSRVDLQMNLRLNPTPRARRPFNLFCKLDRRDGQINVVLKKLAHIVRSCTAEYQYRQRKTILSELDTFFKEGDA